MERGIRILNFVSFWVCCVHVGKDRTDFLLGIYSKFGIYKSEFEAIILLRISFSWVVGTSCRFAKRKKAMFKFWNWEIKNRPGWEWGILFWEVIDVALIAPTMFTELTVRRGFLTLQIDLLTGRSCNWWN